MNKNLSVSIKNNSQIEGSGWLLPLLILVLLAGLFLYFRPNNYNPSIAPQFVVANTDTTTARAITPPSDSAINRVVQIQLSDTTITANKGSIEYKLALYISSNKTKDSTNKSSEFEFDDIDFLNNTAVLTNESKNQLQNVAAIIKRYPQVKISVGCYANDADNDTTNLELSKQRATLVASELKQFGITASQIIAAKGYGTNSKENKTGASETRIKRTSVIIHVIAK